MDHSDRTKIGIAKTRARGATWGAQGAVLSKQNRLRADQFAASHRQLILDLMLTGHRGPVRLARELNRLGVPAYRGGKWHAATVDRLLKRMPEVIEEFRRLDRANEKAFFSKLNLG